MPFYKKQDRFQMLAKRFNSGLNKFYFYEATVFDINSPKQFR